MKERGTPIRSTSELKPDNDGFRYVLMWMDFLLEKKLDADPSYLLEWRAFVADCQKLLKNLAPTGRYNGLNIEGWYQRAMKAEAVQSEKLPTVHGYGGPQSAAPAPETRDIDACPGATNTVFLARGCQHPSAAPLSAARKIYSSTHGEGHTTGVGGHEERVTVITPSDKRGDTPRTDTFAEDIPPNASRHTRDHYEWRDFARQLERELHTFYKASEEVIDALHEAGHTEAGIVGVNLGDCIRALCAPSATEELKRDAMRYRRLRENWIDCAELRFSGRLSAIDAAIDDLLILPQPKYVGKGS